MNEDFLKKKFAQKNFVSDYKEFLGKKQMFKGMITVAQKIQKKVKCLSGVAKIVWRRKDELKFKLKQKKNNFLRLLLISYSD